MSSGPKNLLTTMRKAIVLLTLDECGVPSLLRKGLSDYRHFPTRGKKALRAATELGITERSSDGCIRWSTDYESVGARVEDWKQFIAVVKHHVTYLDLIQRKATSQSPLSPARVQAQSDPSAYRAYLEGVAESHRDRARAFSLLGPLRNARNLVDLGGGIGAYSLAWVRSKRMRIATLLDLPEVIDMLDANNSRLEARLRFHAADLTKISSLPKGDVYLLANVLHLFRGWRSILRNVLALMPGNSQLAVLEATSQGAPGAFFDLQVHLRSAQGGGLIEPTSLEKFLRQCGLQDLSRRELDMVVDPLDREYWLWLGTKTA